MHTVCTKEGKQFSYEFETKEQLEILLQTLKSFGMEDLAELMADKHKSFLTSPTYELKITQDEVDLIYQVLGFCSNSTAFDITEKLRPAVSDHFEEDYSAAKFTINNDHDFVSLDIKVKGIE